MHALCPVFTVVMSKRQSHFRIELTEKMNGPLPSQTEGQMEITRFDSSLRGRQHGSQD